MRTTVKKSGRVPEAKTREAILSAAIDEFANNGFAGARTENIARNAKVNKAMLHYYYHDKETLYNAVLDALYGSFGEDDDLIQRLMDAPINSVQHIHIFLKVIIQKHGDPNNKSFRCVLAWELAAGQNNLKKVAQKFFVPRMLHLIQVLEKGIKNGELSCKNPALAVYSMISQVVFYYMHSETYEGTAIYDPLYKNVSQADLLQFLLRNFIAAYATNSKIRWELPSDIAKLADELAEKMVAPVFPVSSDN
ncbi:MAG: TetR/AcrR family transcriptional regulator [Turneriella sp.]